MLYRLKRHPIPIAAFFKHSLVLTYAFPGPVLEPLLPPGLTLDTFGELGFVAVAMVQTEHLRPVAFPEPLGQRFFLIGYRIFARFEVSPGHVLRGLRILRSDTDHPLMTMFGNLFTHYGYRQAIVKRSLVDGHLAIQVQSPGADVDVIADLNSKPAPLPPGSPFATVEEARHFAGPLPYTFDYEKETHSILMVKGVRKKWDPQPVRVDVRRCTFVSDARFGGATPVLANAFHLEGVPYSWKVGVRQPL